MFSIIHNDSNDPEAVVEVVRDNCKEGDNSMRQVSPIDTEGT